MPLLSIIVPVYNAEHWVGRLLQSLNSMSQESKQSSELVIVDDGSRDGSMNVVESKRNELLPLNSVVLRQDNQGTAGARNTALRYCGGEWVFFLDADDELVFDPVPHIKQSPNSSALGFSVKFYKNLKYWGLLRPVLLTLENHLDILTARNPFASSSIIFKKDRIRSFFDPDLYAMEDWLFWVMNPLIFQTMKIFPKETSAIVHSHGTNKSSNYIKNGECRRSVAHRILVNLGYKLTEKQKNNLLIQSQIGLIQQEEKIALNTLLRLPCNVVLYAKLILFLFLRGHFSKIDFYGR